MNKCLVSSCVAVSALAALASFEAQAIPHNIEVKNLSRDQIDVYVRAAGGESPAKPQAVVAGKGSKTFLQNRPETGMDIVVVSHGSTPDWNPTAGSCKNLLTTTSHTVVVDDLAAGLKFSCDTVK